MSVDPQNSLQQLLGDMLRDEASFDEFIASQQDAPFPLGLILQSLAFALLALLLAAYAVKIYRLRAPLHAAPALRYRLSYRATLDTLAALGLHRRHGESRESFARRLATLTPTFDTMTRAHLHRALGEPSAASQPDWLALQQRVRQELRPQLPWWRHLLAILNPVPWLKTH